MDMEWKPIPGIDGYEASSCGAIRSWLSRGGRSKIERKCSVPRILSQSVSKNGRGYLVVSVRSRPIQVHRLVLLAFVGPCPQGMECCHGVGGRFDNSVSNIRWDTKDANHNDRMSFGDVLRGERIGNSVITDEQAKEMVAEYAGGGATISAIADKFGISRSMAGKIIRGDNRRGAGGARKDYTRFGVRHHWTKISSPQKVLGMLSGGMLQKDVASELGISQSMVSRIKGGGRRSRETSL